MDRGIDAGQIERVLSHLARLKHRRNPEDMDALDDLRPAWLGLDTWDVVLEDLEVQHFRAHARTASLQAVR